MTRHRAFTLIELLVVIGVVAILVVLLVPAVQAAREAARRAECCNKLRQLGLALSAYHNSLQVYPPGYVSSYTSSGEDTGPGWGWAAMILPQLQQSAVQRSVHYDRAIEHSTNGARAATIPLLLCPSDAAQSSWTAMHRDASGNPLGVICQVGPSNYVAMFGTTEPGVDGDGMFFRNSHLSTRDVRDGLSQTLFLGERAHQLGEATWTGSVTNAVLFPTDNDGIGKARAEHSSGMILGHAGEGKGPGHPRGDVNQFYSLHGPGANFVFGDGHVSFLKSDMDYKTYVGLATRAGSESLTGDY